MGADLFGSLAEATCAALVVGATSIELVQTENAMYFPLMITAVGIIVSFFTSFVATNGPRVTATNVETTVKWQLIISTFLMTGAIIPLLRYLPESF
jgi:Na+/H+-translocating membrane pyrophosphatase